MDAMDVRLKFGLVRTIDPDDGSVWWVKPGSTAHKLWLREKARRVHRMSRHEALEAAADAGYDTWADYRGEK